MENLIGILANQFDEGQIVEFSPLSSDQPIPSDGVKDRLTSQLALVDIDAMNGMGLAGKCEQVSRAVLRDQSKRIVMIGSSLTPAEIVALLNTGVWGYLPKSMDPEAIVLALKLVIVGEIFVPAAILQRSYSPPGQYAPATTASERDHVHKLTRREKSVFELMAHGSTNKEIARALSIREVTVKSHLKSVFRKLGVRNRTEAARIALDVGSNGPHLKNQ